MSGFNERQSNYPPGVSGNEPEIAGYDEPDDDDPSDDDSPSVWGPCVICKANLVNYGAGDDTCHACLKSLYGAR